MEEEIEELKFELEILQKAKDQADRGIDLQIKAIQQREERIIKLETLCLNLKGELRIYKYVSAALAIIVIIIKIWYTSI